MKPYGIFDTRTGLPETSPDAADLRRDARPARCGGIARSANVRRAGRRTIRRAERVSVRAGLRNYLALVTS